MYIHFIKLYVYFVNVSTANYIQAQNYVRVLKQYYQTCLIFFTALM